MFITNEKSNMDNLYSSFYLYRKYEIIGDELVDLGITSIDADGTQEPVMKDECDPACGCIPPDPVYRWVQTEDTICVEGVQRQTSGTPYCVGYDKYVVVTVEESFDSGTTWEFVSSSSTLVEADSPDCGYVPPTPVPAKFRLTLSDSSTVSAECDSTSAITSGEVASQYSGTVVSAEIGSCVSTIDDNAFRYCFYLTGITIPNNVTTIGEGSFYYCYPSLTSVTIGNGVTTIGKDAFVVCRNLSALTIGNSVTTIGEGAFQNCEALTSITIPDSVTTIGDDAFNDCIYATSLAIGSGVTYIGEKAFNSTGRLQSITIYATTPPTLVYEYEFFSSNCPIYVPSGSVNAYKSATNWSTYASRIQAIP